MKRFGWLLVFTLAVFPPAACDDGNSGGGGTAEEAAIQEELYGWTEPLDCLKIYYGIVNDQVHLRLFISGHDVGLVVLTPKRPMQEISKQHGLKWVSGYLVFTPKTEASPGIIEVQDFTTFCKGSPVDYHDKAILIW